MKEAVAVAVATNLSQRSITNHFPPSLLIHERGHRRRDGGGSPVKGLHDLHTEPAVRKNLVNELRPCCCQHDYRTLFQKCISSRRRDERCGNASGNKPIRNHRPPRKVLQSKGSMLQLLSIGYRLPSAQGGRGLLGGLPLRCAAACAERLWARLLHFLLSQERSCMRGIGVLVAAAEHRV